MNEYNEWLENPTTKEVKAKLKELKDTLDQDMCSGGSVDESNADKTQFNSGYYLGRIRQLNEVIEVCFTREEEEKEEDSIEFNA